jgi:YihY family inner membrane protein
MSAADVLDRFQQRHRVVGFPIAVVYKYLDDSGPYLAALITYYAFVSLFPLLLLGSTILGFILTGNSELQAKIVNSALAQFPVVGRQLADDPRHLGGGSIGLVVSILGSMYGGLGVAQATQYAMNTAWRVPRNVRPNPFKARGRSLLLLLTVAVGVAGTTILATAGGGVTRLGPAWNWIALAGSYVLSAGIFIAVFRLATARPLGPGAVVPGALIAAVGWQLLQSFGVVFVERIKTASATNGVFALVLGLLAFLYVTSVMIVLCVEINVVHMEKLYPRALLTPFTDNVRLTVGDRRAYTTQATAQRSKGFERVEVIFEEAQPGNVAHPDGANDPPESLG